MMSPLDTKRSADQGLALPRWVIPFLWAGIVSVILILLPWLLSKLGPRFGWSQHGPTAWNIAGLLVVAVGLGLYAWCLAFHFRTYRATVRVGVVPPQLVTTGLYRISRNPMYIWGLFAWLGWTVFYGSPAVLVGLALLWVMFTSKVIPREERQLEELFGDEYLEYKRSVRRWLGRY